MSIQGGLTDSGKMFESKKDARILVTLSCYSGILDNFCRSLTITALFGLVNIQYRRKIQVEA